MHPPQVVLIGQLQDVGFVFLQVLVGCGDAQIADDGGRRRVIFLVTVQVFDENGKTAFIL